MNFLGNYANMHDVIEHFGGMRVDFGQSVEFCWFVDSSSHTTVSIVIISVC